VYFVGMRWFNELKSTLTIFLINFKNILNIDAK